MYFNAKKIELIVATPVDWPFIFLETPLPLTKSKYAPLYKNGIKLK